MNDTVHGHMVQDLLRHRFGSHDNLICKYSSKYPVQAEREFQRLTNAYIRILNELLKEYGCMPMLYHAGSKCFDYDPVLWRRHNKAASKNAVREDKDNG